MIEVIREQVQELNRAQRDALARAAQLQAQLTHRTRQLRAAIRNRITMAEAAGDWGEAARLKNQFQAVLNGHNVNHQQGGV